MIFSILIYSIFFIYDVMGFSYIFNNNFNFVFNIPFIIFISGFIFYYLIRVFFKKIKDTLIFLEVFQHEMTHMIFTFITFHKVYSFTSNIHSGGNIRASKLNPIIVLSPYTIPLYSIFLIIMMFLIKEIYYSFFYFLIGVSFSQYFYATINDLFFTNQPDFRVYSKFLSYIIIIISIIFYILYSYLVLNYSLKIFVNIPVYFWSKYI